MAKRTPKPVAADLTESEAPETAAVPVAAPPPPALFPGYEETPEPEGMRAVTLIGGGSLDGAYRVPERIPQSLSAGREIYNLSDRAAGVYVYRVP